MHLKFLPLLSLIPVFQVPAAISIWQQSPKQPPLFKTFTKYLRATGAFSYKINYLYALLGGQ
ncbi:hypothetical protein B6N25_11870 [Sphingobacteriales bacterium TSM_CSS]|nr:hypothetical protein B6N25_11870 [Sphingobacteriales bacterium TSM_CSS]